MKTVAATAAVVESQLESGALACPGCGGRLAPWGHARVRSVRGPGGGERVRPRRSRCSGCRATHVLLPVFCLLRRAYTVTVIGAALAAKAALGLGHRRIAVRLGVPAGTVRGWLRRFTARAEAVRVFFTGLAIRAGVDVVAAGPGRAGHRRRGGRGRAVADRCVATVRRGRSARHGDGMGGGVRGQRWPVVVPGVAAGDGRAGPQHELSLTPPGFGGSSLRPVAREQVPGR